MKPLSKQFLKLLPVGAAILTLLSVSSCRWDDAALFGRDPAEGDPTVDEGSYGQSSCTSDEVMVQSSEFIPPGASCVSPKGALVAANVNETGTLRVWLKKVGGDFPTLSQVRFAPRSGENSSQTPIKFICKTGQLSSDGLYQEQLCDAERPVLPAQSNEIYGAHLLNLLTVKLDTCEVSYARTWASVNPCDYNASHDGYVDAEKAKFPPVRPH